MKPFKKEPCIKCGGIWHATAIDVSDKTATEAPMGPKCLKCGLFTPTTGAEK